MNHLRVLYVFHFNYEKSNRFIMKANLIVTFAALTMVFCMFFGCKPEEETEKLGTIYGTVTDFASGDPISNVNVRLNPRGETTLTGMDGTFQFNDLPSGSYSLSLSKNGYADLDDDYVIRIESGNTVQRAIQLQKLHYSLQIVDNNNHPITILDFGDDAGVNQKAFNISNNGNIALDFSIIKTANWIDTIVPVTGTVGINDSKPVYVIINRGLLEEGVNNSNLLITTPNTGGIELAVKATNYGSPVVTTVDVTNITHESAACVCKVISDGGTNVTERGICWSTAPNPTINDFKKSNGSGLGSYNCEMTDLSNNTKYYVKAYAKNSSGVVAYGEERSFTTDKFPTFQYGGYTYYVAPDPGNSMDWSSANSYCNNLSLEGMSGWRMPTQGELVQMYAERTSIGGFSSNSYYSSNPGIYWSSTSSSNGYHNAVYFYDGSVQYNRDNEVCRVRPIRRKN